jgi:hypothetical protein
MTLMDQENASIQPKKGVAVKIGLTRRGGETGLPGLQSKDLLDTRASAGV